MRKILTALVIFGFCCAIPAQAEIRDFTSKICPICVDLVLKSEVDVGEARQCTGIACKDEHWDQDGNYVPATACSSCTTTYYYRCTQGHEFETLLTPQKQ